MLFRHNADKIVRSGRKALSIIDFSRARSKNPRLKCSDKRIYHYHIRKTGGTSLNHIFLSLTEENPRKKYEQISKRLFIQDKQGKIYVAHYKRFIEGGNYFYGFSHTPAHQLSLPKDTFTVTIIRDPIKRVISHYKMIKKLKEDDEFHPCMQRDGRWLGNTLMDFVSNMPNKHLLRQIYMFSQNLSVEEAYENITSCSHFFLTDDFSAGISSLSKKTGLQLKPLHIRKLKDELSLSDKDYSFLKEKLEPEIRLYEMLKKYKKEHP